jgi:hypothetical protein
LCTALRDPPVDGLGYFVGFRVQLCLQRCPARLVHLDGRATMAPGGIEVFDKWEEPRYLEDKLSFNLGIRRVAREGSFGRKSDAVSPCPWAIMETALSTNGVPIRLTEERWFHIVENHDDLAGHYEDVLIAIEDPDFVLKGYAGALIGMRGISRRRYLAVVYREVASTDGFVITAYFSSQVRRRSIIWQRQ